MNPSKFSQLSLMDKVRIVVECNQLAGDKKEAYLLKEGIDQSTFEECQKEAAAVVGIGTIAPIEQSRCQELIEQLRSSNEALRRAAAKELGRMRSDSIPAIEHLIDRMLYDNVDFVRNWASWSLTRIEPKHPAVAEAFLQVIEKEEESSSVLGWSLAGIAASKTDYVINRLFVILNTGTIFVKISAIDAMFRIGNNSSQFIVALKEASDSKDELLRKKAIDVLSEI